MVDNLVDAFGRTNVRELMEGYGSSTEMADPVLHFYESFLGEYDPTTRKKAGVYYTPDPVVKFIVKSVDEILQKDFGLAMGLADNTTITRKIPELIGRNQLNSRVEVKANGHKEYFLDFHKVQVLDPATGTGTFLLEVFRLIHSKFGNNPGIWQSYAKKDLIPRIHGFELLMASYSMAHLKLAMYLSQTGVDVDQRISVYLTNSLEEGIHEDHDIFAQWLSEESRQANRIKTESPVMVVIGNPPYSGESDNRSQWIMHLMEDYKKEPNSTNKLNERNPKWINDDYVKFLRFGQHFVDKNNQGIVAFICPHGFLDNPTFRGVRWSLLNSFDKIYTIDLHGNSKKKEVSPDGSKDENVFDIQQGVSINILVKTNRKSPNALAKVYHTDLYGTRQVKYDFLSNHSVGNMEFAELKLTPPMYYMVQKDFDLESEYIKGVKINELMPDPAPGFVTCHDQFAISITKSETILKIKQLINSIDKTEACRYYKLCTTSQWNYATTKKNLENTKWINDLTDINYRPFDKRFTIFTSDVCTHRRYDRAMRHFYNKNNLGLIFVRQNKSSQEYSYIFLTDKIFESSFLSNKTGEITYTSPLYLYPEIGQAGNLFGDNTPSLRATPLEKGNFEGRPVPNFDANLIGSIELSLSMRLDWGAGLGQGGQGEVFTPTDLLDYIYASLHSPSYRERFKEFLKIDFPRVSFEVSRVRFWELVGFGAKLRQLHLMENIGISQAVGYPISGNNIVEKLRYEDKRVWINATQYFDGVSQIAWDFYIGGYQPAQKWLKDRKGRELEFGDIIHYQSIIGILVETDRIMQAIG